MAAEPNGESQTLQFTILDSHQADLDGFNQMQSLSSGFKPAFLPTLTTGSPVFYRGDLWELRVDGAVYMTCAGSGGNTAPCSPLFLDGQA
jgi:hypothetical protein